VEVLGFESKKEKEILSFSKMSRPDPEPTHSPIHLVWDCLSLNVKQPGCEANHSPPSSAEVKNDWSYASNPPTCLYFVYRDNVK